MFMQLKMLRQTFLGTWRFKAPLYLVALTLALSVTLLFCTSLVLQEMKKRVLSAIGLVPHIAVNFEEVMPPEQRAFICLSLKEIASIERFGLGYQLESKLPLIVERQITRHTPDDKRYVEWQKALQRRVVLRGLQIERPSHKNIVAEIEGVGEKINMRYTEFRPKYIRAEVDQNALKGLPDGIWWVKPAELLYPKERMFSGSARRIPYYFQRSEASLCGSGRVSVLLPLYTLEMNDREMKDTEIYVENLAVKNLDHCFTSDINQMLDKQARERIDYLVYGPVSHEKKDDYPPILLSRSLFDDIFRNRFYFKNLRMVGENHVIGGKCVAAFNYNPLSTLDQDLVLFNINDLWKQMDMQTDTFNRLEIRTHDIHSINIIKNRLIDLLKRAGYSPTHYKIHVWNEVVGDRPIIHERIAYIKGGLSLFLIGMTIVIIGSVMLYYLRLIRKETLLLKYWGMRRSSPLIIVSSLATIMGIIMFSLMVLAIMKFTNRTLFTNYVPLVDWPKQIYFECLGLLVVQIIVSSTLVYILYNWRRKIA